jgi:acyl transferase domain-containing protein
VEYALARLWQSWGVSPDALVGHSVGQFVALRAKGGVSPFRWEVADESRGHVELSALTTDAAVYVVVAVLTNSARI